jgi:hypothetical protein
MLLLNALWWRVAAVAVIATMLPGEGTAVILRALLDQWVRVYIFLAVEVRSRQEALQAIARVVPGGTLGRAPLSVGGVAAAEEDITGEEPPTKPAEAAAQATPTALTFPPGQG